MHAQNDLCWVWSRVLGAFGGCGETLSDAEKSRLFKEWHAAAQSGIGSDG